MQLDVTSTSLSKLVANFWNFKVIRNDNWQKPVFLENTFLTFYTTINRYFYPCLSAFSKSNAKCLLFVCNGLFVQVKCQQFWQLKAVTHYRTEPSNIRDKFKQAYSQLVGYKAFSCLKTIDFYVPICNAVLLLGIATKMIPLALGCKCTHITPCLFDVQDLGKVANDYNSGLS